MSVREHVVPLRALPELTPWLEQEALKRQLLAKGEAAFVELAAPTLKRSILTVRAQRGDGGERTMLKQLLRRGFTHDEIARAFAIAWRDDADYLQLPRHPLTESALLRYGIPLLVLGALLVAAALATFGTHPRWLGPFIYLAPLLMLAVAPVLWLLVRAWQWALRRADRAWVSHATPEFVDLTAPKQAGQAAVPAHYDVGPEPPSPEPVRLRDTLLPIDYGSDLTMADQPQTLTIDGAEYPVDALSDQAKQQLANLQVCDQEIQRLQQQLGIAQTARASYARALQDALPKAEH